MPGKKALPVAIAFTLFAGLALPAMAQQTRDREQATQQKQQEQRTQEMKGPAAEAVGHLKDAYSELAKSHASLIAGKWDDAERSLDATRDKLEDAAKVRNLPNDIKTMISGMQRHLADLDASITRRDKQAANTASQTVRMMGQNMDNILATHGPATGGGGGPQDKQQQQKMQQRGGGGGAQDEDRMEDRTEQEKKEQLQEQKRDKMREHQEENRQNR